jgi:hypothetical protein
VEPTYCSPDRAVQFTAREIDDLLRDLPALREMSVIGMLKHTDEIFVLKGYRPAERKLALRARLRKLHMDATARANGSAAPGAKAEAASKPKKKRVWGDDYM